MYGHGIVTLTLAELLGMGMDEEMDKAIRKKCQSAIDLILRSQKVPKNQAQQGGWRYSLDEARECYHWHEPGQRKYRVYVESGR